MGFYWMLSKQTAFLMRDCAVKCCESFYTELYADILFYFLIVWENG